MKAVECPEHGAQPATYVCQHLLQTLRDSKPRGFFCANDGSEYPDAWCHECEQMLVAAGGEWTEDLGRWCRPAVCPLLLPSAETQWFMKGTVTEAGAAISHLATLAVAPAAGAGLFWYAIRGVDS
jgi:hypothetical protein